MSSRSRSWSAHLLHVLRATKALPVWVRRAAGSEPTHAERPDEPQGVVPDEGRGRGRAPRSPRGRGAGTAGGTGEGWVVGSARLYNYIRGEPTATGTRSRAVPHTGNFRCRVYGTNTSPGLRPRPHLGVLVNPTLEHTSPTTHIASPGRAVDRPAAGGERPRIIEHVHGRLTRGLAPAAAAAATMAAAAVAALATTRGQLRPWAHSRYTPG